MWTFIRQVLQALCSLIIARAALLVSHNWGFFPEQWLAGLVMDTPPSPETLEVLFWGLLVLLSVVFYPLLGWLWHFLGPSRAARTKNRELSGAPADNRNEADESNSQIIRIDDQRYSVIFPHQMRCTPTIRIIEPITTKLHLENWSSLGFTVIFENLEQDIKNFRFYADARSEGEAETKTTQDRPWAFVTFSPNNFDDSFTGENISSVTDNGVGDYTVTFVNPLKEETLVCHPIGIGPRNFKVLAITSGSVRIKFDEPEPDIISLRFDS